MNISPERHKEFTRMQGMVNMRPIVIGIHMPWRLGRGKCNNRIW